jgi:DNA-binding CsgD family transcriptional regulator
MPMAYANVRLAETDIDERRLEVRIEIPDRDAACAVFLHASAGGMRGLPAMFNLPCATVEADISPRVGTFRIHMPASKTMGARARRGSAALLDRILQDEVEASWLDARARHDEFRAASDGLEERVERVAQAWRLTSRQRQILVELARGRSSKEIAATVGCAVHTAEIHVGAVLRRAGVTSRAALIAAVWDPASTVSARPVGADERPSWPRGG